MPRLLLAEDDRQVGRLLKGILEAEAYQVDLVTCPAEAERLIGEAAHQVALVDLNLAGQACFALIATIRARRPDIPILVVSAHEALDDRVRALDAGADDYLVKPFEVPELLARLRAHTRRTSAFRDGRISLGSLTLELVTRRLRYRDEYEVDLTAREFDLVHYLAHHRGRPVSRQELMREVWKEERSIELDTNVVEVCIAALRKKLERACPGAGRVVVNTRGKGYTIQSPGDAAL